MRQYRALTATVSLAALVACTQQEAPAAKPARAWEGKWFGPEGTYLVLTAKPDSTYEVVIRNLDGERRFQGLESADGVSFERDGRRELIKGTDGAATGMKWLDGKTNCLTVRLGEGYCRESSGGR